MPFAREDLDSNCRRLAAGDGLRGARQLRALVNMDGEDAMLEVQEQPQLQGRGDRLYGGGRSGSRPGGEEGGEEIEDGVVWLTVLLPVPVPVFELCTRQMFNLSTEEVRKPPSLHRASAVCCPPRLT